MLATAGAFAASGPGKAVKVKRAQTVMTGNPVNAQESGGYGGLDILLTESPATEDISITYEIGGTAVQGSDYYAGSLSGSTTILTGQTSTHILLGAINDNLVEGDETVIITITGATGLTSGASYALGDPSEGTFLIIDNDNVITAYSTGMQAAEPGSDITAKFQLPGSLTAPEDITIDYFIDGGTATNGVDYQTPSGQIVLPAGSNSVVLSIPVIDDKIIEGNETVKITLSDATAPSFNLTLSTSRSVSSSILDDDSELSIGIAGNIDGKENPSSPGRFTISLPDGVTTDNIITVVYSISGTATNGIDYTTLTGKAFISKNKGSVNVIIPVTNDMVIEGLEDIVITLLSGSSSDLATFAINPTANTTIINIEDDDNIPLNRQIHALFVADGGESTGDGSFKLALPGTYTFKEDMTVTYTVSGSAVPGTDYTALSGSATLVAGQNSVLVTVPVLNDALIEGDESVVITPEPVTVDTFHFAAGDPCTVMIIDDDDDNLKVAVNAYDTTGGEPGDTALFRVSLPNGNAASVPVTVTYSVEGTAINGTDYDTLTGTVVIPVDSSGVFIPVIVKDDELVEGMESVKLTLEGVTSTLPFSVDGSQDTDSVTIADDDNINMDIVVDATIPNGAEPGTVGEFTVSLASGKITSVPIDVTYTSAGTATSGTDYTAFPGTVTIPPGSTSATVMVPVLDDDLVEGDETVSLTLDGATAGLPFVIGAQNSDTVTINDDDDVNMGIVISASANGAEPNTPGEFTVSLASGKIPLVPITITYTVAGTAASGDDYTALSGTVTIPANSSSATFPVPVLNDTIAETDETVIVQLTGVTATMPFTVGAPDRDTVIIDDDDTEQVIITAADPDAGEPANAGQLTIHIASGTPATADITIDYEIAGTATNGVDYTNIASTAVIPAGSSSVTIPISVLDDDLVEGPENILVTLQNLTSAVLYNIGTQNNAAVTIDDDDDDNMNIEVIASKPEAAEPGDDPAREGEFTIRLASGKTAAQDIDVSYAVGGSALNGTDYDTIPAQAVIPAGSGSIAIPIRVIDDIRPEGLETVSLTINNVSGALPFTFGPNSSATVNVLDDDTVLTAAWLSARHDREFVSAGDAITYTIHISNGSDTDQVNVIVRDRVPAYTVFVYAEGGVRPDASGLLTWVIPQIARGTTVTLELRVNVADDLTGADTIYNTGSVDFGDALGEQPLHPADPLDPNVPILNSGPNDPATAIPVNKSGGFVTWKTVKTQDNSATANAGEELLYRIYVRNTGGVLLSSVNIVDTIPANTVYVSNATGGIYDPGTNTISWNRSIGVKVKDSVTFLVKVVDDVTGVTRIANQATVSTADSTALTGLCDPASSNCSGVADTTVIPVDQGPAQGAELSFPNVFTPNGDGLNEYFKITNVETYPGSELYIYNRWGGQVFAAKDYRNDWNGNGLNEGTYFYVLRVKIGEEEKLYKGWVEILR
ncbi:Calx-beta domain-containing protein [Chitinophaga japonensis]|nr:Calx-beta domain-containing protein [Chitinophaga japonensis]